MRLGQYIVVSTLFSLAAVAAPAEDFGPLEERAPLRLGGFKAPKAPAPKPAPAKPVPQPAAPKPAAPKPANPPANKPNTKTVATTKQAAPSKPVDNSASKKSTSATSTSATSTSATSSSVTSSTTSSTSASSSTPLSSTSTPLSSAGNPACPAPTPNSGRKGKFGHRAPPAQPTNKNTAAGGKNQNGCGPDGQIDCSGEGAGTCATMCYAALCLGANRNTGLQLEGQTTNTGPLTKGDGKNVETGTTVRVDNRRLSGCNSNPVQGFKDAGLTATGGSCDEWPPASSTDGGERAVLQMVKSQKAQSAAVKAGVNVGKNGLILMRKFSGVQECVDLQNQATSTCGNSKKFAIFDKAPRGKQGSTFQQAVFT